MTDPTARQGAEAVAETEQGQSAAPADAPAQAAADPLAEAQREAAEYKDRLLRTLAEMENLRKRTEREVSDMRQYGIASFARDVLAVAKASGQFDPKALAEVEKFIHDPAGWSKAHGGVAQAAE